jgi:hypothetical protein
MQVSWDEAYEDGHATFRESGAEGCKSRPEKEKESYREL